MEQAVAARVPIAVTKLRGFDQVDFNGNCLFMDGHGVEYYKNFINNIISDKELYNRLWDNASSEEANQFLYSQIANMVIDDIYHP